MRVSGDAAWIERKSGVEGRLIKFVFSRDNTESMSHFNYR